MAKDFASTVADQRWLGPVESGLGKLVRSGLRQLGPNRERVESILHGEPLGHPLHVMLTDVPLGSWTTAVACDALAAASGKAAFDTGARTALSVGLLGALGAAVTGLADWSRLRGEARRVGAAHGLLNVVGVVLMATSLVGRRSARQRLLALGGFAVAITSARLGGHLVYQEGVGTRLFHLPAAPLPTSERAA